MPSSPGIRQVCSRRPRAGQPEDCFRGLAFLALPPAIFAALTAISSYAFSGERKRGIGRLKPAAIWKMPDHNNNLRQAARGGTKMKAILRVFSFFVFASLVISLAPPRISSIPWRRRLRRPRGQNYTWHSKATHTRCRFDFSANYPESTLFKMLAVARTAGSVGRERRGQSRDLHHV